MTAAPTPADLAARLARQRQPARHRLPRPDPIPGKGPARSDAHNTAAAGRGLTRERRTHRGSTDQ